MKRTVHGIISLLCLRKMDMVSVNHKKKSVKVTYVPDAINRHISMAFYLAGYASVGECLH